MSVHVFTSRDELVRFLERDVDSRDRGSYRRTVLEEVLVLLRKSVEEDGDSMKVLCSVGRYLVSPCEHDPARDSALQEFEADVRVDEVHGAAQGILRDLLAPGTSSPSLRVHFHLSGIDAGWGALGAADALTRLVQREDPGALPIHHRTLLLPRDLRAED